MASNTKTPIPTIGDPDSFFFNRDLTSTKWVIPDSPSKVRPRVVRSGNGRSMAQKPPLGRCALQERAAWRSGVSVERDRVVRSTTTKDSAVGGQAAYSCTNLVPADGAGAGPSVEIGTPVSKESST